MGHLITPFGFWGILKYKTAQCRNNKRFTKRFNYRCKDAQRKKYVASSEQLSTEHAIIKWENCKSNKFYSAVVLINLKWVVRFLFMKTEERSKQYYQ